MKQLQPQDRPPAEDLLAQWERIRNSQPKNSYRSSLAAPPTVSIAPCFHPALVTNTLSAPHSTLLYLLHDVYHTGSMLTLYHICLGFRCTTSMTSGKLVGLIRQARDDFELASRAM
ncbi:hypothetical protein NUW54_g14068 [Trametes sanguinea]|uniref:Uncharacterized protein n=1 Tax=Trametes sanguinea TaxID=158606 RepID=A0ACC1MH35_9APHY|nr:hypothetical protein NUW54_g14068 [Trametes sanguinea]